MRMFDKESKPSIWLSFKINLLKRMELTIFVMFMTSIAVFSCLILLFDVESFLRKANDRSSTPFFLAIYQVIITLTSVGYGDFAPKTWIGRTVIMFCALWGAVMISFIVLVVSKIFRLTD